MSELEPGIEEEVLKAIKAAWTEYPDMRLTQLLINALHPSDPCTEVYGVEDRKLIKLLNKFKDNAQT